MSLANRAFCSKHKQHRLAQIKAELYNGSKDMLFKDEQAIDADKLIAAAAASADAANLNGEAENLNEEEDLYSTSAED